MVEVAKMSRSPARVEVDSRHETVSLQEQLLEGFTVSCIQKRQGTRTGSSLPLIANIV